MAMDAGAAARPARAAPSATCSPAALLLHRLLAGEPPLGVRRHRAGRSSGWRRAAASSCACRGRRRSRCRGAARDRQPRDRRRRSACAIAARARSSARSTAGSSRAAGRAAARSRCCSTACAPSATCRRCPGLAPRVQRVHGDRGQRTDEIARPSAARHGASLRAAAHAEQLGAGAGHPDLRQRPGADAAPRRRADRRRRRARRRPTRLRAWPGAARRRRRAALLQRRSTASAWPGTSRRRCARPATTPRWSTSSPCCRTSAGCCCTTTSPTRPSRSSS